MEVLIRVVAVGDNSTITIEPNKGTVTISADNNRDRSDCNDLSYLG